MTEKKIVVIGGGTGLSVLLRGLKHYPVDISAIVTVADDGGSSGRLREELNIPPPGDIRNVLVALAEVEPLVEQLFQHRFEDGNSLSGHSLGNLLLAGMTSITGDFARGITEISKVLNVRGNVYPAANRSIVLNAEMADGTIIAGESQIPLHPQKIERVFLTPGNIQALPACIQAIREADLIALGPGSLYTSVLPNLLVPGIADEIRKSKANKVYICNVMTQQGETDGYSAADHAKAIVDHCGEGLFEYMLVNEAKVADDILQRYQRKGADLVQVDEERIQECGIQVIRDQFVIARQSLLRHDSKKVSEALIQFIN